MRRACGCLAAACTYGDKGHAKTLRLIEGIALRVLIPATRTAAVCFREELGDAAAADTSTWLLPDCEFATAPLLFCRVATPPSLPDDDWRPVAGLLAERSAAAGPPGRLAVGLGPADSEPAPCCAAGLRPRGRSGAGSTSRAAKSGERWLPV